MKSFQSTDVGSGTSTKFAKNLPEVLYGAGISKSCVNLASIREVKVKFGDLNYRDLKVVIESTIWSTVLVYELPGVIDRLHTLWYLARNESITEDVQVNVLVSEVGVLKSNRDDDGIWKEVQAQKVFVKRQWSKIETVSERCAIGHLKMASVEQS